MKDPKDDLLNLIRKSHDKSRFLVKKAGEIGEYGQYVIDLANASEDAINCVSDTNIDLQPKIRSWQYLNQNLDRMSQEMKKIPIDVASSSASTATASMIDLVHPYNLAEIASPSKEAEARKAAINLGNVIDKLAKQSKATELLHEFGLSTAAPGRKSPTELLEAACAAFERPVTQIIAASTSLIPMRECMNSTLAALLQRRPKQEPAKSHKDKILSIGRQVARSGITDWAIESMAEDWEELLNELSTSKQKDLSREEWRAILRRAIVSLIEFLQSLDLAKMR